MTKQSVQIRNRQKAKKKPSSSPLFISPIVKNGAWKVSLKSIRTGSSTTASLTPRWFPFSFFPRHPSLSRFRFFVKYFVIWENGSWAVLRIWKKALQKVFINRKSPRGGKNTRPCVRFPNELSAVFSFFFLGGKTKCRKLIPDCSVSHGWLIWTALSSTFKKTQLLARNKKSPTSIFLRIFFFGCEACFHSPAPSVSKFLSFCLNVPECN